MWDRFLNKHTKNTMHAEAGDTLVEVFVALVIISVAIAGGYAMAGRSITLTQGAQERAEAVKTAESQIELIKYKATVTDDVFIDGREFCLVGDTIIDFDTAFAFINQLSDVDSLSVGSESEDYPVECLSQDRYHTHVSYEGARSRFTVTVRWERFGGGGVEQTQMVYGIHQ